MLATFFVAYAIVLLGCVWLVSKRYMSILNPVTFYALFSGLQTLVAPYFMQRLGLLDLHSFNESDLSATVGFSALYFIGITAAFLLQRSPFERLLQCFIPKRGVNSTWGVKTFLLAQPIVLFGTLIVTSPAGLLWITNPRVAYQFGRAGSGIWWSLCQASLLVAFGSVLVSKKRHASQVLLISCFFGAIAFFLGSKAFVLYYLFLGVFYIQCHIESIKAWKLATLAGLAVTAIVGLQILQGTAAALVDTLAYFDYCTNTATFISDFGRTFEHRYGAVTLSNAWFYVPRAAYPDKPYTYGAMDIGETYNPGAAEMTGSTPGILPWAGSYWDFGIFGIVLDGLFTGLMSKAAFDLFRRQADIWRFLLFGQVNLLNTMAQTFFNAPFLFFALWLAIEWAFLKLLSTGSATAKFADPGTDHRNP